MLQSEKRDHTGRLTVRQTDRQTDVALVASVQPPVGLDVVVDSQRERVRQVGRVVLRPARHAAVQTAVLLYRHVQRLHRDHVTCPSQ